MNFLRIRIEAWFDRRATGIIRSHVAADPELAEKIRWKLAAIYRVALPDTLSVTFRGDEGGERTIRRGWSELLALGYRIYLLDGYPGALFSRPQAVFAMKGLARRPAFVLPSQGAVTINGEHFAHFNQRFLQRAAIFGQGHIPTTVFGQQADDPDTLVPGELAEQVGAPIGGDWPEEDRPVPTQPPGLGAAPPQIGGHKLFYGLCFQGYSEVDDAGRRKDRLWEETVHVGTGFRRRGYRVRYGLAGVRAPDESPANTCDEMILGLLNDIPTDFCKSPDDQLVVYVAAHGYGGQWNPTGDVALRYEPGKEVREWVSYPQLARAFQNLPPEKTYLLLESCRSGRAWDALPHCLQGLHLLTAVSDADSSCYPDSFSRCIRRALEHSGVDTWTEFIDAVKYCMSKFRRGDEPLPPTRSGDR